MKYKLLALDMDGTLLNSNKEISNKNLEFIKKAQNLGVKIVVCTGRIYKSALYFGKKIGSNTPVVACNGAYIKEEDMNKEILNKTLNKDECRYILDLMKKDDLSPHVFTTDTIYTERLAESSLNYLKWNETLNVEDKTKIEIVEDIFEATEKCENGILKIVAFNSDREVLNEIKNIIKKETKLSAMKSLDENLEIMAEGVSKAAAVDAVAKMFKIKEEEVICVGDNENDISMIKYAGLGVAMGNATDELKAISNYVTDTNNNDGIAKLIDKFIL